MPYILVRHKVEDYAKWRPAYDEHGAARQASGCKGTHVFRNAEDPNEIVMLLEWDDLENARQLIQSENLREAMKRSGVADQPDIYFLDDAGRTST
jgi:heme-degrading monooxygenase HmoA